MNKYSITAALFFVFTSVSFSWEKKDSSGFIQPGRRISSSVILSEDQISYSYKTFKVRIPDNAFKMEVKIDNSQADLDIYMNFDREIENYDNVDYSSTLDLYNEKFSLNRLSSDPLYTGVYYIDIVYPLDSLPIINNREVSQIPFGVTVKVTTVGTPEILIPDRAIHSSLSAEDSILKVYAVDVDPGVDALRIDLFDTKSDLDMYIRYKSPALSFVEADFIRESYLGRESLVIDGQSVKPLRPGRYYISVFDRIEDDFSDDFSLIVSYSEEVPDFLKEYPQLPQWGNELEEVLYATVEISTETGSGSGCIVSEEGYIITGLHVITDTSGEIAEKIYVSMNLSNFYPPRELFRAELVDKRDAEDLVLLKIVSGFYGQDLIDNYSFPHYTMALDKPVQMGQPLSFLGYPQIGSEGSRASISLTRGIVSGFNTMDFGLLIKTDGEINSGNSGGAAFNQDYELIGFPMSVISDEGGQLAYIHPVSLIPETWLEILGIK
ncbi:MAG: trypsin-like peptidase domain-containing protein [Spirochaetaceae bacterium]|nr:trypsin-like peptidase domain-containing protein [Spirochaetaceae bacterium]